MTDPDKVARIPFVPPETWKQLVPNGPADVQMRVEFTPEPGRSPEVLVVIQPPRDDPPEHHAPVDGDEDHRRRGHRRGQGQSRARHGECAPGDGRDAWDARLHQERTRLRPVAAPEADQCGRRPPLVATGRGGDHGPADRHGQPPRRALARRRRPVGIDRRSGRRGGGDPGHPGQVAPARHARRGGGPPVRFEDALGEDGSILPPLPPGEGARRAGEGPGLRQSNRPRPVLRIRHIAAPTFARPGGPPPPDRPPAAAPPAPRGSPRRPRSASRG